MKRVAEEWTITWQRTKVEYDEDLRKTLSSPENQEFLRLIKRYIKRSSLVLEAGCGYGHKCILFSQLFGANVVGVDIVVNPLKYLHDYLKYREDLQVSVVTGDVTKLPFRNNLFDIITSFGVIEHFRKTSEVIDALNEASRVLKVGGFMILVIPNFAATFRNVVTITITKGRFGMYHKPYTMETLESLVRRSRDLKLVESGFLPFGFRSLILEVARSRSMKKLIYFLYHAFWHIFELSLKFACKDYQSPIYIVAEKS